MQRKKRELNFYFLKRNLYENSRFDDFLGQVLVSGSGSSVLMETDIPIVPQATCQSFFNQAFPGLIKLTNSHVCAGSIYPVAHDSCNGDSGKHQQATYVSQVGTTSLDRISDLCYWFQVVLLFVGDRVDITKSLGWRLSASVRKWKNSAIIMEIKQNVTHTNSTKDSLLSYIWTVRWRYF